MYTELRNKVALSPADNKRYIIPGSHNTLAWGHRDIHPGRDSYQNLDRLLELLQAEM